MDDYGENQDFEEWVQYYGFDEEAFDQAYNEHFREFSKFKDFHELSEEIKNIKHRSKERMNRWVGDTVIVSEGACIL